jgi:hypothetical protein
MQWSVDEGASAERASRHRNERNSGARSHHPEDHVEMISLDG